VETKEVIPIARNVLSDTAEDKYDDLAIQRRGSLTSRPELTQLTFTQLDKILAIISVQAVQQECELERALQEQYQLDEETFQRMRADLVHLHMIYKRNTDDSKPLLLAGNETKVFQQFGFDRNAYSDEGDDEVITFPHLLDRIEQVREKLESQSFNHVLDSMLRFTNGEDRIEVKDLVPFVQSLELEVDPEAFNTATRQVFIASNGEDGRLNFDDVKRVLQRSKEIANRRAILLEVRFAVDNGFKESELGELKEVFCHLDEDGSGLLDIGEAFQATEHLHLQMSWQVFEAAFGLVDKDGSGGLDLQEFMSLFRILRDRKGPFAENRKIMSVSELNTAELQFVMGYFMRFEDETSSHIGDGDEPTHEILLQKVCDYFHVHAETLLRMASNFQDLCVAASKVSQGEITSRSQSQLPTVENSPANSPKHCR
jgi:Ca2+-binding EF-hand superfamily protein